MSIGIIIGVIAIVAFVILMLMRSKKKGIFAPVSTLGGDPSIFDIGVTTHPQGTTPKGMKVVGYQSPSVEIRQLADAGVDRTFEIAENVYGYTGFRRHDRYMVGFFAKSNVCEQEGFVIEQEVEPGTNYDGSVYDKDPRPGHLKLCVAGLFQIVNSDPAIFVVDTPTATLNASAYEAEHAVLFDSDPTKYFATQYHQNGGHPILPDTRVSGLSKTKKDSEVGEITLSNGSKVCALLVK